MDVISYNTCINGYLKAEILDRVCLQAADIMPVSVFFVNRRAETSGFPPVKDDRFSLELQCAEDRLEGRDLLFFTPPLFPGVCLCQVWPEIKEFVSHLNLFSVGKK